MLLRIGALTSRGRVLVIAVFLLLALLLAAPSPVQANDPEEGSRAGAEEVQEPRGGPHQNRIRLRHSPPDNERQSPQSSPARTPGANPRATAAPAGAEGGDAGSGGRASEAAEPEIGWDISYPQCGGPYPESPAFAIVGVNGGRVYSANPCLGDGEYPSQLLWAGPDLQLYINTGNPGPRASAFWPSGQNDPRSCGTGWFSFADTHDCAYVYGWNAAADSYRIALEAFISVGWLDAGATALPTDITWWLDVETANSWRFIRSLNVAALEGAVAYLESRGAQDVGFYSTPRMWSRIVGSTDVFAAYPAWHGGATNLEDAQRRCASEPAFTGGELRMVQWIQDGFDANILCSSS